MGLMTPGFDFMSVGPALTFLSLAWLQGCTEPVEPVEPEEEAFVDIRVDFPDPVDEGQQFLTPDLEIGPYEEIMYCYYDTYVGPAAGVVGLLPMYSRTYVHHLLLRLHGSQRGPDGRAGVSPGDPGVLP